MPEKRDLVVILGPTNTGKTHLGIRLAQEFSGEIISGDSMQVYQGMDIGTGTPSLEERRGIPHYLISSIPPNQEFSVADFQREAAALIKDIHGRGRLPFLVGGSGLYLKAILEGFLFPPFKKDALFRASCQEMIKEKGIHFLYQRLKDADPKTAQIINPLDERRIIRALEVIQVTGKTPYYYREEKEKAPSLYRTLKIGLTAPREYLYQRIENRIHWMIQAGLLQEVKDLLTRGFSRDLTSMQGLGYKEITGYLFDEYDLKEAIDLLKRNTRRFAKRQITWFKKEKGVIWFSIDTMETKDLEREASLFVTKFLSH